MAKEIVLVLHHTYLHNTFRDYPHFKAERFDEIKSCRFIARFIVEKKTNNQAVDVAITSGKIFGEFVDVLNAKDKLAGADKFVKILDKLICKINAPQINNLNDAEDGLIALTDKIYSTSADYEPVLVITKEAKAKFEAKAKEFYKATLGNRFTVIPFRILTIEETTAFLEDRYPLVCKMVKERLGSEPF